jgi:hypothetical protein
LATCIKPQPEPEYGLEVDIASEAVFPPVTYMFQPEVLELKLPFERIVPGTANPKIGDDAKRMLSIINASRTVLTLIFMFYFSFKGAHSCVCENLLETRILLSEVPAAASLLSTS